MDNRFSPYIKRCEESKISVTLDEMLKLFEGNSIRLMKDKYEAIPYMLAINVLKRFSEPHANKTHFIKYDIENVNMAFGLYIQSMMKCNFIGFYDDDLKNEHYMLYLTYNEFKGIVVNKYNYVVKNDVFIDIEKYAKITFR